MTRKDMVYIYIYDVINERPVFHDDLAILYKKTICRSMQLNGEKTIVCVCVCICMCVHVHMCQCVCIMYMIVLPDWDKALEKAYFSRVVST